jgi:hypothetical protein
MIAACCLVLAASAHAQPNVTRMQFSPPVVPEHDALPILFEATVDGDPASVAFEYDAVDRPMYDDGTNDDRVPGDGIWTIRFQPSEILGKLTAAWVFRPFIGFCEPTGGGRFSVFAEVWTSSIGLAEVRPLEATTQDRGHSRKSISRDGEERRACRERYLAESLPRGDDHPLRTAVGCSRDVAVRLVRAQSRRAARSAVQRGVRDVPCKPFYVATGARATMMVSNGRVGRGSGCRRGNGRGHAARVGISKGRWSTNLPGRRSVRRETQRASGIGIQYSPSNRDGFEVALRTRWN